MTAEEVSARRASGYDPRVVIEATPELRDVLDMMASGVFSPGEADRYKGLIDLLTSSDWFMVAADFAAYAKAQRHVDRLWSVPQRWNEKAIRNTANMAWFSADRTIREYAREIWTVPSM
jgi:glycogen phosphorylase